jgi:hypothetical protein
MVKHKNSKNKFKKQKKKPNSLIKFLITVSREERLALWKFFYGKIMHMDNCIDLFLL